MTPRERYVSDMNTRGKIGALALVMSALIMSGCASPPATDPSATTDAMAAPTSSTPTATPTPPPAPGPVTADWTIRPDGLGPIRVGQNFATETTPLLAQRPELQVSDGCVGSSAQGWIKNVANLQDPAPGTGVTGVSAAGFMLGVPLDGDPRGPGTVVLIIPGTAFRTAEGIGAGSTFDEVRAAYPDVAPTEFPYGDVLTLRGPGDARMHFVTGTARDGVIEHIEISTKDRAYPEYCG